MDLLNIPLTSSLNNLKMKENILINSTQFLKIVHRLSNEILEAFDDYNDLILIGIKTRGEFLAQRIYKNIKEKKAIDLSIGIIDITFHRDDFSNKFIMPKLGPSDIPFDLTDKKIILIDDVLFTGRTIRAAMDEIFSFGRPNLIKLAVIVDRGHRELPIRPDFVGKNFPTQQNEHIIVKMEEIDRNDEIIKVSR